MATSSFDKNLKVTSDRTADALIKAMDRPKKVTVTKNIKNEIERGEALLKRLYSR